MDLTTNLLEETGCATLPGSSFGRAPEELSLRLAFVNFDGEEALNAVEKGDNLSLDYLKKYCGLVL